MEIDNNLGRLRKVTLGGLNQQRMLKRPFQFVTSMTRTGSRLRMIECRSVASATDEFIRLANDSVAQYNEVPKSTIYVLEQQVSGVSYDFRGRRATAEACRLGWDISLAGQIMAQLIVSRYVRSGRVCAFPVMAGNWRSLWWITLARDSYRGHYYFHHSPHAWASLGLGRGAWFITRQPWEEWRPLKL